MNTRRNIILWILYDFANSLVSIVFFLYFAQWVVIDQGVPDLFFNFTFTIAAVLLLATAPLLGSLLDASWRRIAGVRVTTCGTAFFYGLCALAVVNGMTGWALVFFTLGLYAYLLSFTFYTPLLNDIASSKRQGLVSGLGIMVNYIGQFAGLAIVLPFATGSWSLMHAAPRAETLLPSVLLFFICALPMLLFFEEPKRRAVKQPLRKHIQTLIRETRALWAIPSIALFLTSYFLFNDAVLTAANNFPIFLEQVWGIGDTTKTALMLGILITSAIGGVLSGMIADHYGHKRTLVVLLAGWIVLLPLVGLLTNFTLFVIATILMGFWFGANWTVSRSVMAYIAPEKNRNLAYAYFGLAERASSFVGPILWGVVVGNLSWLGGGRYRVAVLVITGFILFGLLALLRVRDDRATPLDAVPS